jgi:hypothetical protein
MGDPNKKITSYIVSFVEKFFPKHEESIHSGLFLLSNEIEALKIIDWYFNGYSVISETVSSHIQNLCKDETVRFTHDGIYELVDDHEKISKYNLNDITKHLEDTLAEYDSGIQIVQSAQKLFSSRKIGIGC